MSGILKRKFEDVEGASPCSSVRESDDEISESESAESGDSVNPSTSSHFTPSSILKREKRMRTKNVRFDYVTVYYFTRRQGFTSVPSQGGSTLGMSNRHKCVRQYTLGEFALEQERVHGEMLKEHLKEEKLNSLKLKLTKNGTVESEEANTLTLDDISDDDIDLDNTEVDDYFFLQPLPTKKRRALLRASGVKKIDGEEKHELRAIRVSREDCGCDCRIYCDPELCACSQAGIKCQVDRMSFPCGCTKEGCSNTAGRIEFNPIRVRTHFLHTIMKLELEKNQQQLGMENGFSGDMNAHANHLLHSQQPHEYSVADSFDIENEPEAAVMHLQSAEELDWQGEDDEEEDDDGSSLCSGITDSSVQSLAASESDEDADSKAESFTEALAAPVVTQTEANPLSSVLCYADGTSAQGSTPSEDASYFSNSSTLYYQIEGNTATATTTATTSTTTATTDCGNEPFCVEATLTSNYTKRSQENEALSLVPYGSAAEQYIDYTHQPEGSFTSPHYPVTTPSVIVCCPSAHENNNQCNSLYAEQRPNHTQAELQSYLNNHVQEDFVATPNGDVYAPKQVLENTIILPEGNGLLEDTIKTSVVETVFV
ncbi:cysteine/serine-rich nuclear protein 3 [Stegostoma tigrinum]|uniref:cysteine/serine-rich nuclear protein 3 n=1 Tax=Stegostoma tigrinum TaxID=3053191 RepID=UPI00287063C2|nr:cysteine/serine-rich nuclear protein 3 [Stegostoma tigrinum]XP_048391052.2 cysteine/serine-rich nuclear protein 3 [Stegostoma tigrinum]XP_048391053.2 cysteine/serine-rich nuclear protein 3 [Stegostoma tigrinum]XP_048391054.2 cysteine/serine-rich nuclear protein 3 [Stegostoma tigrinum]XP_048391055.2 cysteine/serine-rich nuclear protein 3 [Stegostoma tigrinum]XP_048391056.2 cysteine/serine-rich nuclear protein 3 [Stegostoma tigrinum]XP_048391058.2 cysteine/serine-rich nuclear protein 3 [Steg